MPVLTDRRKKDIIMEALIKYGARVREDVFCMAKHGKTKEYFVYFEFFCGSLEENRPRKRVPEFIQRFLIF